MRTRPSPQHCVHVKVDPDCAIRSDDEQQHPWPPIISPDTALGFLSMWRNATTPLSQVCAAPNDREQLQDAHGVSRSATAQHSSLQRGGTLSIGSVVFAPYRASIGRQCRGDLSTRVSGCSIPSTTTAVVPSGPPAPPFYHLHYALAQVTGIQATAGTVTVSFLFSDAGIDDEAVSLYECVPCPPGCLTRWLDGESDAAASWCSVLERVMRVSPHAGPLPVTDIYRAMQSSSSSSSSLPGAGKDVALPRMSPPLHAISQLRDLYCLSDNEDGYAEVKLRRTDPRTKASPSGPLKHASGRKSGTMDSEQIKPMPAAPDQVPPPTVALDATTGWYTITARYVEPRSLHTFYATVFQEVNTCMEQLCRRRHRLPSNGHATTLPSPSSPPVILVLFDNYATLRRFQVFMTVRGHVVQLRDGTNTTVVLSKPRTTHAFGAECKMWLCMLRDDTREGDEVVGSASRAATPPTHPAAQKIKASMEVQLRHLLKGAPPIDALVSFTEPVARNGEGPASSPSPLTAEAVLQELMPLLGIHRAVCELLDIPTQLPRPTPSYSPATAPSPPSTGVVKVSGALFGRNKILVPCSPEQLTILATVWTSSPLCITHGRDAVEEGALRGDRLHTTLPIPVAGSPSAQRQSSRLGGRKRQRAVEVTSPAASTASAGPVLTPILLERIALGSFTDAAAATLFDVFGDAVALSTAPTTPPSSSCDIIIGRKGDPTGAPARATVVGSIDEVYRKWCVDPACFGEAFPVFAAVYAMVEDIFACPSRFRPSSPLNDALNGKGCGSRVGASNALPRIAIVLPRGNPTHHPKQSTQQYQHTLHAFFAPWAVFEVASSSVACAAPVLWHKRGGILLLFCDEASTQLGALHDEADVVIACGKTAAAWVAANGAMQSGLADEAWGKGGRLFFAVISEVEVVAATEHLSHVWLPATLPFPSSLVGDHMCDPAPLASVKIEDQGQHSPCPRSPEKQKMCEDLEAVWRQLVKTVGAHGNAEASSNPYAQLAVPLSGAGTSVAAHWLRQAEALPNTLRQAIMLWRHLSPPARVMTAEQSANARSSDLSTAVDTSHTSSVSVANVHVEELWPNLRSTVKAMALSCTTAAPVRTSDVVLVRSDKGGGKHLNL